MMVLVMEGEVNYRHCGNDESGAEVCGHGCGNNSGCNDREPEDCNTVAVCHSDDDSYDS